MYVCKYVCVYFFNFYLMHAPLLQVMLHAPWLLPILLYIILLYIQFGDSTTYRFLLYNLSKVMLSVNFLKVLLYLLTRISLLMGHFSVRSTAAFSLSLSCSTSSQSYIVRSIVCYPFLHEHIGLSMILYLYKYDLILPCLVTNIVKFGVTLIFSFNLSAYLLTYLLT
jgi:hypothetical protein